MPYSDYPCQSNNGECSHLCLLSPHPPGYTCACPTGVKLKEGSNMTCHNGPQSLLLVAHRSGISKISLDSSDYTPYALPLKDVKGAIAVDFDPKTEHVYWADNMAKTISRARLDGSEQMTVIHSGVGVPDNIAVDSLARNIYWTDPVSDTITVARLDGSFKKVIIHDELYEPRAIALHPMAGWMFWSDWNDKKPKIERANLDGTDRKLIVFEKLAWPNGIALDMKANKMYWGDAKTHKIEVSNMDGSERREIHNTDILHIFGLTLLGDYLYWTDMQRRSLERVDKVTGKDRQFVVEQMANMLGLKAIHLGNQEILNIQTHPCSNNNGNCSHLCFNRQKDYICSCPLGLELGSDRKTCVEPEAFLVYSRKNIIGRISIENENNDAVLPLKELKEVNALTVHVSGSKLYWSDTKTKTINRCSINGSNMEKIIEWTGLVEGLAIDWPGQNIFWTDTSAQRIEVARLDGSSRRTLIWQGLKKPKSIILDPKKGFMYWSELGSKTIRRAYMDGSNPSVLIEQVGKVNSLAIDYEKRTIYWAAIEPSAIEYARLDGSERRKILSDNIPVPYALALYMDRLYWGDWSTGDIESVIKTNGSDRQNVHKNLDFISDLKVYHKYKHAGSNQCGVDNGGCAHLCLALPSSSDLSNADYKCSCATHYKLDRDNLTCLEPEEFLLFAHKNTIGRVMITSGESYDAFLPITGLRNVKAIEYDPVNRFLYWMDEDSHSIRRVTVSSSTTSASADSKVVVAGLTRPFHMALDVLGRALYWSCTNKDSINATSIMYRLLWVLFNRYLVWNDIGLGCIMRANLDGTSRIELAQASNATALAIDQATGVVYWAMTRQIHAVDVDGTNRRTVWQGGWVGALGALGGSLFWGGGDRAPMRLTLARRDAPATPLPHVSRITAIVIVHKVDRDHPCWGGTTCGGGPGACLAGGACGCGLDCVAPATPRCSASQFLCTSAGAVANHPADETARCVPNEWKCDGQEDCADGSDEGPSECGACVRGLRCADGGCADSLGGCSTGALCPQGPLPDAFRCDDRLCLAARLLCDGSAHCADGSDEAPTACGYVQKDQIVTSGHHSNAFTACGIIIGVAAALGGVWMAVRRCRGGARRPRDPDLAAAVRLNPTKPPAPERARPLGASCTDSVLISGSLRCSGSDSTYEHYPRPTLNPPPSPATASASTAPAWGAARRRAYRHYRAMNRPPPPTPATTDAGDSDATPRPPSAPPPSPDPQHHHLYR
ncbi:Low-density lipoprotein receptor-related protein 6 [Eumeta japonica]|uniref:Low-density lipoprotein receptor-related protein 6 n=1 Tax=Eumeta variegata TaxID=151549 RepID=A0A4C1T011_EUMVA|nr:Low-density lipoprotein receptor-related protein 6 [Eumeta japonica]